VELRGDSESGEYSSLTLRAKTRVQARNLLFAKYLRVNGIMVVLKYWKAQKVSK
jgi:hypothetical protein